MKEKKPLVLNVEHKWFELMVTGEKTHEYRKPSKWIKSRLWKNVNTRAGSIPCYISKEYVAVKIISGYGNTRPYFIAKFRDHLENITLYTEEYSNGLQVKVEPRDIIILLGEILKIENYDLNKKR